MYYEHRIHKSNTWQFTEKLSCSFFCKDFTILDATVCSLDVRNEHVHRFSRIMLEAATNGIPPQSGKILFLSTPGDQ